MLYIYAFEIKDEDTTETGLVCAKDYPDAMRNLIEYAGSDYESYRLTLIAESTLHLGADTIDRIKQAMVW